MTATATVQRRRGRDDDQPRALIHHDRLGRTLKALYATDAAVRESKGDGVGQRGGAPIPLSAAVVDARAYVERTLARLETVITQVLTGGDSAVRVSGWWGIILCPVCGQDTLLLDLGARWVSCTNTDDCDDNGSGRPWSDAEGWLEERELSADDGHEALTLTQRQRYRIAELEDTIRVREADNEALAKQAAEVEAENARLRAALAQ